MKWLMVVLFSTFCLVVQCRQLRQEKVVRHGIFVLPESKLETKETTQSPTLNLNKHYDKNSKSGRVGGLFTYGQTNEDNSNGHFKSNRTKRNSGENPDSKSSKHPLCSKGFCLQNGYSKLDKPSLSPIDVEIKLDSLEIIEVDDLKFSVSLSLYFVVQWFEPRMLGLDGNRLNLNSSLENASSHVYFPLDTKFAKNLWVPDVYIYNLKYISRSLKNYQGRLFIINGTYLAYQQEVIITIWCPMRFEFYPLDHQSCEIKMGSYSHDISRMTVRLTELKYNATKPNAILAYVAASFLIPPDLVSGRMTLLVTIFLVLINIFNSLQKKVPNVDGVTALSGWILICLIFVFAALASYAVLLYRKYYQGGESPSAGCFNLRNILKIKDSFTFKNMKKSIESVNLKYMFKTGNMGNGKDTFKVENVKKVFKGGEMKIKNLMKVKNIFTISSSEKPEPISLFEENGNIKGWSDVQNFGGGDENRSVILPALQASQLRVRFFDEGQHLPGRINEDTVSLQEQLNAGHLLSPPRAKSAHPRSTATPAHRPKRPGNSTWQDFETSHIDQALLFTFPALFVLFNAIYWAIVINGGQLP